MILPRDFYDRPSAKVARHLLGKILGRETPAGKCGGRIVEVEAYEGLADSAAHSYRGKTPRNASMFGPPGHAYVYTIHSRWCFNAVTEPEGVPTAVLIRAIEPLFGLELMAKRRSESLLARRARLGSGVFRGNGPTILKKDRRERLPTPSASILLKPRDLCRGPARLCEALAIIRDQDGWDLTLGRDLWIEDDPDFKLSPRQIIRSPRIGISSAQERLLRFSVRNNPFVSGKRQ
ncbi:MAG: DNA-3-methyladenine glycosylase [Pirellulaceae bacterium]